MLWQTNAVYFCLLTFPSSTLYYSLALASKVNSCKSGKTKYASLGEAACMYVVHHYNLLYITLQASYQPLFTILLNNYPRNSIISEIKVAHFRCYVKLISANICACAGMCS